MYHGSIINYGKIHTPLLLFLLAGLCCLNIADTCVHIDRVLFESKFINPRRACTAGITVVSLCVCLSVTAVTATYLVRKAKVRYHMVLYSDLQICNMWLSLKTLLSKVMALFAYHYCLPRSLASSRWTEETAVSSFLDEECVCSLIVPVNDWLITKLLSLLSCMCLASWPASLAHVVPLHIACKVHSCGYSSFRTLNMLLAS